MGCGRGVRHRHCRPRPLPSRTGGGHALRHSPCDGDRRLPDRPVDHPIHAEVREAGDGSEADRARGGTGRSGCGYWKDARRPVGGRGRGNERERAGGCRSRAAQSRRAPDHLPGRTHSALVSPGKPVRGLHGDQLSQCFLPGGVLRRDLSDGKAESGWGCLWLAPARQPYGRLPVQHLEG